MAGNANSGRRRNTFITDAVLLEIKDREKAGDKKGLRLMAVTIMDLAEQGERWACEFVRDTVDGKPMQQVEMSGEDGGPVVFRTIYETIKNTDLPKSDKDADL